MRARWRRRCRWRKKTNIIIERLHIFSARASATKTTSALCRKFIDISIQINSYLLVYSSSTPCSVPLLNFQMKRNISLWNGSKAGAEKRKKLNPEEMEHGKTRKITDFPISFIPSPIIYLLDLLLVKLNGNWIELEDIIILWTPPQLLLPPITLLTPPGPHHIHTSCAI